jgi:hypothetical protein
MQIRNRLVHGTAVFVVALIAAAGAWGPAVAGTLTFDFGTLIAGAGSAYSCAGGVGVAGSDCTVGTNPQSYTTGGVTIKADAFAGTNAQVTAKAVPSSTVSQRFNNSAGERGLGVASGTDSKSNGSSLEIGTTQFATGSLNEFLLIDASAAVAAGDTELSVMIGSEQNGEGGQVAFYSLASVGSTLDPSKLNFLGAAQSPNANDEQVINLGGLTDNFLVISSDNLNVAAGNVLLENVIFSTPDAVPEPATAALLGSGLIGIFLIRRRRNV